MTTPAALKNVGELADVRTGDKGDTLILGVFSHDEEAHAYLIENLTADRVAVHYGELVTGTVRRSCLVNVSAMVFELPGVLGGGVTGSPSLDGHGKTLSYHLLSLRV